MDSIQQKAHFFRRVSFGPTLAELDVSIPERLNAWFQDPTPVVALPVLDLPRQNPKDLKNASKAEKVQFFRQVRQEGQKLGAWLLEQMVTASNPLHEAMTYFWRDHFVVSMKKFNLLQFVSDYEQRLRLHALGDFRDLLWSVTTSPAMLLYLDNQQNRVGNINENYSRELMELFTLGRGYYTEQDVQEGARALTGWTVNPVQLLRAGEVGSLFVPRRHDSGEKTFLGATGFWQTEDIVDRLANHPQTAQLISRKLWSYFAYPNPEEAIIQRLAQVYLSQNRRISSVVAAIFESPEFYSERAYRRHIKSPLYFVLGSIRQLGLQVDYQQVLQHLRTMGHVPYTAPSVKGWPVDEGCLSSVSLLNRINLAQQMTGDYGDETGFFFDAEAFDQNRLLMLLVDGHPSSLQLGSLSTRESAALILASPLYQLA
jgi:uncharacterized protein (DUF1800 family)